MSNIPLLLSLKLINHMKNIFAETPFAKKAFAESVFAEKEFAESVDTVLT